MTKGAKYIAFDWNGTLLDDTHLVFDATNAFLKALSYGEISREKFHATYALPVGHFYRNLGIDEVTRQQDILAANPVFHDHYEAHEANIGLRPGANEILDHARASGLTSVIFSNHIVDPIRAMLKRFDIEAHFDDVIAFESRALQFKGLTKGERLANYLVAREVDPKNVLVVGDSNEEIHHARKQGHISVAIEGGCISKERLASEKPDHLIHSLAELKPILQERGFA